jgi:hypothetical protein
LKTCIKHAARQSGFGEIERIQMNEPAAAIWLYKPAACDFRNAARSRHGVLEAERKFHEPSQSSL